MLNCGSPDRNPARRAGAVRRRHRHCRWPPLLRSSPRQAGVLLGQSGRGAVVLSDQALHSTYSYCSAEKINRTVIAAAQSSFTLTAVACEANCIMGVLYFRRVSIYVAHQFLSM